MQSARFVHASVIVCAVVPALAIAVKAPAPGKWSEHVRVGRPYRDRAYLAI